jgi:hypothetical protein
VCHARQSGPTQVFTIFAASLRLQKWMNEPSSIVWNMTEQDRRISEIVAEQRARLRNFIRRRVPDPLDAEDVLQDVFFKLLEANRLLMPIEHVTGWLFRVARNRIPESASASEKSIETMKISKCATPAGCV